MRQSYSAIYILLRAALNAVLLVNDRTDAGKLLKCSAPWNSNEFR